MGLYHSITQLWLRGREGPHSGGFFAAIDTFLLDGNLQHSFAFEDGHRWQLSRRETDFLSTPQNIIGTILETLFQYLHLQLGPKNDSGL
jgi:hypothetical protein